MNQRSNDFTGAHILVVDDDPGFLNLISLYLEGSGFTVVKAKSGDLALKHLATEAINVLLADLNMPGMSGYELFRIVNRDYPHIPVIIISGQDDISLAVRIIKEGGFYYLPKPVDLQQVKIITLKALAEKRLQREIHELKSQIQQRSSYQRMLGKNAKMQNVFQTIKLVAPANSTILVLGESGTGKELVAQAIHAESARHSGPFVAINCGAIPATLMESELFGHERGAFTGATLRKLGTFEVAHTGTLFLDEIGELPLDLQVKLLRVLQDKKFCRIGGTETITVDVRVVAASNKDLKEEVKKGAFRHDLYYRLSVIPITLPPLRDRLDDVPLLAQHFLTKYCCLEAKTITALTADAMRCLLNYDWPGNVRELENVIERAVVICQREIIGVEDLPVDLVPALPSQAAKPQFLFSDTPMTLHEIELLVIRQTLEYTKGNKSQAAQLLGITRKALYARLRELAD